MTYYADRHRWIAARFTATARAVPEGAWDNPAPCEGWVARDVVRHLVEWIPAFWAGNGVALPDATGVDDDPAGAWERLSDAVQAMLDDPEVASQTQDMRMGRMTVEQAMDMICTNDVFLHTWDLARATGLDERLDPDEVHRMYEGMLPLDEVLRASGHYGPRVEVPDDADEQTKLLSFIGRQV
jgi:uncharacterized protein (TIGR03086 family)